MKNRILNIFLMASAIVVSAAAAGAADARWRRVAPEGTGFSVEAPGEQEADDQPGQYSYSSGLWFYCIKLLPADPGSRIFLERGDKKALRTRLASTRDTLLATVNAKSDRSSFGELDGYPSLGFSLDIDGLAGTNMLVLTGEHMYMVMTLGPKGARDEDAKRFLASFRLTTDAAGRATTGSPANGDQR
jgi:hypothetical protein